MPYLSASKIASIKDQYRQTLPGKSLDLLLSEIAAMEIDYSRFKSIHFAGRNGAGAVTLTGAKVGDRVILLTNITDEADGAASFEATITVANQIQQSSASNLTTKKFAGLLLVRS